MATIRAPSGMSLPRSRTGSRDRISFVVVEDDRDRVLQGCRLLEDDLTDPGVLDHRPPLGRRQRRRLVEDLVRDRHLADVVEERRDADPVDLVLGQRELAIATTIDAITADGWPR